MAIQEKTYTASIAAKLTGFNVNTLKDLRVHSALVLEGAREGWTRYTFTDLVTIRAYAAVRSNGFAVEAAVRIANFAAKRYRRAVAPQSVEMPGQVIALEFVDDRLVVLHDLPHEANVWSYIQDLSDDFTTKRISVLDLTTLEREVTHRVRQGKACA